MPRISAFYGVVIAMYFNDHAPPHFHAIYGEHEGNVLISTLEIAEGSIPPRAASLVKEWAALHRHELLEDWLRAREGRPLLPIEPLP